MRFDLRLVLLGFLLVLLTGHLQAMFALGGLAPVDRLISQAQTYLEKHPQEAEAHYILARIHYLAFVDQQEEIRAYFSKKDAAPALMPFWVRTNYDPPSLTKPKLSEASLLAHAGKAKKEFESAMLLDSQNGLYALGLASLLEEVRRWNAIALRVSVTEEFKKVSLSDIRHGYEVALILSLPKDQKLTNQPIFGLEELVSYEAARALVRLGTEKQFLENEEQGYQKAKDAIAQLKKIPPSPVVTPIVFSFLPTAHLAERLAPETLVDFDLRGYGWKERWTWVKPSLGFLVWDPLCSGKITSARQLFGSYTFQIFRKTGYDALAALDDNGDGVLSGTEMRGISVWVDRNSDGVSQSGEVTPVEDLHIHSIGTTAQGKDGIHPMNRHGLVMDDGRVLPTWDWIAEPVRKALPMGVVSISGEP